MKTIIISAKKTLEDGDLVIFPTETVYGLGGDATNVGAIKKIYGLKKRPFSNPLICHFKNIVSGRQMTNVVAFMNSISQIVWSTRIWIDFQEGRADVCSVYRQK